MGLWAYVGRIMFLRNSLTMYHGGAENLLVRDCNDARQDNYSGVL